MDGLKLKLCARRINIPPDQRLSIFSQNLFTDLPRTIVATYSQRTRIGGNG